MAALLSGEPSHHGAPDGNYRRSPERQEEDGAAWYFSRRDLDENSPSRRDGIDLKKETYLRKSYCTFLQDLGMRLKVPQVTIATAIIFCHRFFLRQSHAKNDRRTIATVCMFLAGKVEETPRPLKDVILVSYEIIHKKDAAAVQRIKQKEVYEQQKELILVGERVVLGTLGYDLNVNHPYKPLVEAIKKFKVAQNALAQVAWNFVNDGLRTSLCLQFMPHHIAAGAIFLAAKFLKVKLPSDGERVWWQEFDVTPRQLEEVSNQMLELYEQNRMPQPQVNEAEGSAAGSQRAPSKGPADEEHASRPISSRPIPDGDNHSGPSKPAQTRNTDSEISIFSDRNEVNHEREPTPRSPGEIQNKPKLGFEGHSEDDQEGNSGRTENRDLVEPKDKFHTRNLANKDAAIGQSPQDSAKKLDREKLKAAFELRRKNRTEITRKVDPVDEIERELEDVELPSESEKIKREKKQSWHKQRENENFDNVEEGELEPFDQSPRSARKRKPGSPLERSQEGKQRADIPPRYPEDRNGLGRAGYDREHKRHVQENHV